MPEEDIRSRFGREMFAVARVWRRALTRHAVTLGISDGQWAVLDNLNRSGEGVPQSVLADRMGLERSGLVRLLREMEAAGLTHRDPDPQDARSRIVSMTDQGREMAARILDVVLPIDLHLLRQRSDAELNLMLEWLSQVRARIEDLPAEGPEAEETSC
ncbi:MarR family winged helix-turn-helix transcriptional regulator [Falsigemmobacter faecalis]|uniref:MarR family transcriptional regulator n=1 Tax=Falsigemmobacter faecalis TaxID=2488730 RepID=A0A3P3DZ80_9RHOB|nr:MarR family transcriptional regulator [Falsigemmobacter faecalis]RRH78148.1 MarR family transcriptional regulator [Falsigemmobacter faecalis]